MGVKLKIHELERQIVTESDELELKLAGSLNKHPISFSLGWGERDCKKLAEGFLEALGEQSNEETFQHALKWLEAEYFLNSTRAREVAEVLLEALQEEASDA